MLWELLFSSIVANVRGLQNLPFSLYIIALAKLQQCCNAGRWVSIRLLWQREGQVLDQQTAQHACQSGTDRKWITTTFVWPGVVIQWVHVSVVAAAVQLMHHQRYLVSMCWFCIIECRVQRACCRSRHFCFVLARWYKPVHWDSTVIRLWLGETPQQSHLLGKWVMTSQSCDRQSRQHSQDDSPAVDCSSPMAPNKA